MPDTLLHLGSAWLAAGDAVKAAEAWERVTALRPEDLDLRRRLADAYEKNLLPARAIAHLDNRCTASRLYQDDRRSGLPLRV